MASGLEVVGDRSVRRQKALGMPGRGEPLHTTLALTRGPMRVLTALMHLAALPVFHPGQLSLSRFLSGMLRL